VESTGYHAQHWELRPEFCRWLSAALMLETDKARGFIARRRSALISLQERTWKGLMQVRCCSL